MLKGALGMLGGAMAGPIVWVLTTLFGFAVLAAAVLRALLAELYGEMARVARVGAVAVGLAAMVAFVFFVATKQFPRVAVAFLAMAACGAVFHDVGFFRGDVPARPQDRGR